MIRLIINGLHIHLEHHPGLAAGLPLIWLHGFTGRGANWMPHMAALSDTCASLAIDALGHGDSDAPHDPSRYAMPCVVEDVLAVADHVGWFRFGLVGYSMGGRMALHVAAAAPERIGALVLESASPGLLTPEERALRVAADADLASLLEQAGISAFLEHWEHLPLFASQQNLPRTVWQAQRVQRLENNPHGLAASLRGVGTGVQEPLHDRLRLIDVPTLVIAGELDTKFTRIAKEMTATLPQAQAIIVPEVGHAVHLEAPIVFDDLVRNFIRRW